MNVFIDMHNINRHRWMKAHFYSAYNGLKSLERVCHWKINSVKSLLKDELK